jgi:hypothetical protein
MAAWVCLLCFELHGGEDWPMFQALGQALVSILALFCTVGALMTGVAGVRNAIDKRKTARPLFQKSSSVWQFFTWFTIVAIVSWLSVLL